jgi:Kef-type K+ transport system membrane component KefB
LCVPKILSTLFATFFFGMRAQDGFALGLLLNTKGVVALIMLNISWDRSVLIYLKIIIYSLFLITLTSKL